MVKEKPLVSIAMASYNCGRFICEAIESIINQTYKNWELILVIDGDTDNTLEVAKKYIVDRGVVSKCRIFCHDLNYGYGAALRNAIEKGHGELVAIVDADDSLADDKALEIMVAHHEKHPNASLVYSNYYECNKDMESRQPRKCSTIPKGQSYLGNFSGTKYTGTEYNISHLKVFKRKHYDMTPGLDHTLLKAVDKCLILMLEEVGDLIHINNNLYNHRNHRDSISSLFRVRPPSYKAMVLDAKNKMYFDAKARREAKTV